jgi:hypothetical protein
MKKNNDILNLNTKHMQNKHQKDLGLSLPDDYFKTSKAELLKLAAQEVKEPKSKLIKINFVWAAAASVVILLSIGFLTKYYSDSKLSIPQMVSDTLNPVKQELLTLESLNNENETLVSSLFIDDDEIDAYLDDAFINDALKMD